MAETSSLLNCRTGNRTGGSNPPLSAARIRGVAQSGSAPGLGPGGPRFESWYPDNINLRLIQKPVNRQIYRLFYLYDSDYLSTCGLKYGLFHDLSL